jgi:AhpC/TSA family protein
MKLDSRTNGRWLGVALAATLTLGGAPARAQHADHADDASVPLPAAGELIQPFDTQTVDGAARRVAFEGKGSTVLLFFLSSCPTCHRMIPEWNRAFQRRPQGLQVIGVIMDRETPGFFQTNPISFPVVRAPSRELLQKMKISRVPLMIRVASGGKIEDVAMGYNDPIRVGEIFRP